MTLTKDFASKLIVAFVAVAMVFSMFASTAKAQTAEELQQMINDLLAQVAALQATTGQGGTSVASGVCPYTWTRDLSSGSTGADVMKLQQFLNADADTRVAAEGAGSVGAETEYYGPATAAAVSKMQVKYRADILSPANLVNPTGYFGPSSRAKANSICVAGPAADEDEDGVEDEEDEDVTLSGEASLSSFEVADGEDADDVEEGSEDIAVAEITVEFADGDASISRLDIALEVDSGNDGDDSPWKVFDEISLWVDGDKVADIDASDKDNYLDEDDGSLRFSGLDIVAMEDEEVVITVAATVGSSIDGAANGEGWNIAAGAIRFFDADGVATTEETYGDLQDISDVALATPIAEFSIEEAGEGDDLNLESSDENPDATTLALDEDDNVEHAIFAFDLSAEDSDGDVELSNMISIGVTVATTAASVGDSMDNLVADYRLEIGGESFAAESYTGTGLTAIVDFDIDGDVVIDADSVVTAVLYADFEDMDAVDEGSTIFASTSINYIDAEGVDSGETVTLDGGTKTGETHTLRTTSLVLSAEVTDGTDSSDSTQVVSGVSTAANYGTMFLEFEVTAFGDDVWVPTASSTRGAAAAGTGITYQILESGSVTASTGIAVSIDYDIQGADEDNGYFELTDGETYTMVVTVESLNPQATGLYSFRLNSIGYNTTEDTTPDTTAIPSDVAEYVSDAVSIQN